MKFECVTRKQVFTLMLMAFAVGVLVRIPNFFRPLSKHHEYLPAVVLMNAESWRQAGGGAFFRFTPVMNYQNPGDKYLKNDILTKDGNVVYLSIGPGWYIIPYAFFEMFNFPISVTGLRFLNLCFGFLTLIACINIFYYLLHFEDKRVKNILVVSICTLMFFSPGILWYFGNGYTHSAIVLPFAVLLVYILMQMIEDSEKVTTKRLLGLMLLFVAGIYIDWFILFIGTTAMLMLLFQIRKSKKYYLLMAAISVGICAAVGLILWQFSFYVGFENVKQYWVGRFLASSELSIGKKIGILLSHYGTSYLPMLLGLLLILLMFAKSWRSLVFSKREIIFISLWSISLFFYHALLFNWSFVHEFSVLPASVLVSYISGKCIVAGLIETKSKYIVAVLSAILIAGVLQYYYINPPGRKSLTGTPYNIYEKFGNEIKEVDPDVKMFMNMPEANPMIEFYAKRNLTNASDTASAKDLMKLWGLTKAAWIEEENFKLIRIIYLQER